ncbi:hypothetical protein [uncultured Zhongshania sp.]|tara:strand:- start:1325 stop:1462 length:138 start_codon:yes stop_codon:yes gene_type:complete
MTWFGIVILNLIRRHFQRTATVILNLLHRHPQRTTTVILNLIEDP